MVYKCGGDLSGQVKDRDKEIKDWDAGLVVGLDLVLVVLA